MHASPRRLMQRKSRVPEDAPVGATPPPTPPSSRRGSLLSSAKKLRRGSLDQLVGELAREVHISPYLLHISPYLPRVYPYPYP